MLNVRSLLRRHGICAAIITECAALLLILTLTASGAHGQDSGGWVKGGYTDDPTVLCHYGRPAPRRFGVTYGNLPRCPSYDPHCPPHSYERDHICPLGLGCPDILSNLQYQSYLDGTAQAKDERERQAEEYYCANPSPELLGTLRAQFKRDTP